MSDGKDTEVPVALEKRIFKDNRLFSSSAERNKGDIAEALRELIPNEASILEIGSGTGEHGVETLSVRPDITWQFSDPDSQSRASQSAWIDHHRKDDATFHNFPPLNIDASSSNWAGSLPTTYDVLFAANMIHIAPIEALIGLASQASLALKPDGKIILYGPFLFEDQSAPSNLKFDSVLKGKNSAWGVRELGFVKHIFAKHGFNHVELRGMPKNNHIIGLSRL